MKLFSTTILLVIFTITTYSQVNSSNIEISEKKDTNGKIVELIYYDKHNKKIIKKVYISDLDPYVNLNYPKVKKKFTSIVYDAFDLSNRDNYQLFNEFLSDSHVPDSLIKYFDFDFAIELIMINTFRKYRFIEYQLVFYNKSKCPLGEKTSVIVLDSSGNIISKILNSNLGFDMGVVTNDGHYLAYWSSATDDVYCFSAIQPTTAVIYDLKNNKQIFQVQNDSVKGIHFPFVVKNFNFIVIRYNMRESFQYNIFFPDKRIVYKKIFTKDMRNRILSFDKNGVTVKDNVKGKKLLTYDKFFIKEIF